MFSSQEHSINALVMQFISQIFLVVKVYLVKFRYREDHEINVDV